MEVEEGRVLIQLPRMWDFFQAKTGKALSALRQAGHSMEEQAMNKYTNTYSKYLLYLSDKCNTGKNSG